MNKKIYDLVIIGAGPAGLTAAIFAARYGLNIAVFEKLVPGGQITVTDTIENYPGINDKISGYELANRFKKHAERYDIDFENEEVIKLSKEKSKFLIQLREYNIESYSVIMATGSQPRKLSIPGEEEFIGRGVSFCATCDGPFYKDKNVAVIGGGNTAVEEALYLSEIANSVKLVHKRDKLRAVEVYRKRIEKKGNVDLILESVPIEIIGEDKVKSLKIKSLPKNKKFDVKCDGIFVFIGYLPNKKLVEDIVDLDDKGHVISDDNMSSSCEGLFVAGDLRRKRLRQVITACSDGAIASDSAYRYVSELKGEAYSGWAE